MRGEYADIINLPHPVSRNHPQMPMRSRAAQFAPFAALKGFEEALEEAARRAGGRRPGEGDSSGEQQ